MNVFQADRILLSDTDDYKHLLYSDDAHRVPRAGVRGVLLKNGYLIETRGHGDVVS